MHSPNAPAFAAPISLLFIAFVTRCHFLLVCAAGCDEYVYKYSIWEESPEFIAFDRNTACERFAHMHFYLLLSTSDDSSSARDVKRYTKLNKKKIHKLKKTPTFIQLSSNFHKLTGSS